MKPPPPAPKQGPGFHGAVTEFKRRLIEATLVQLGGNRTRTARALGLQRTYLLRLMREFGVNVPRMVTVTYGLGVALAAFAGVLAAPIRGVSPEMGSELIIVVFAVVVIGGMGSIMGSIVTGFALGLIEGLTKVVYPAATNTVVFALMALVLLVRPAGLFGKAP